MAVRVVKIYGLPAAKVGPGAEFELGSRRRPWSPRKANKKSAMAFISTARGRLRARSVEIPFSGGFSYYGRGPSIGGCAGARILTGGRFFLRALVSNSRSFAGLIGLLKMAPSNPSRRLRLMM